MTEPKWFCVQVKAREADRAEYHLKRQGYEVFRPMVKVDGRGKEGVKEGEEEDAFPGYQFVHLAEGEDETAPIKSTRGVVGLVRMNRDKDGNRSPTPVPDTVIDILQTQEIVRKIEYDTGDTIRITKGPFEGYETVIEALRTKNGEQRVMVLMEILGSGVTIEMKKEDVEPVYST